MLYLTTVVDAETLELKLTKPLGDIGAIAISDIKRLDNGQITFDWLVWESADEGDLRPPLNPSFCKAHHILALLEVATDEAAIWLDYKQELEHLND